VCSSDLRHLAGSFAAVILLRASLDQPVN